MRSCVEPPRWAVPVILVLAALLGAQAGAWCGVADSAQVQYDRGAALEKQGKHAEAIAEWQNLLTQNAQVGLTDPQLATVKAATMLGIGEAQRQSDQLDAAKATFTQLLSDYPQCRASCVDAIIGIAKVCRKTGDTLKVIEMYAKVLSDYPDRITRGDFAIARLGEMPIPSDLQTKVDSAIAVYDRAKQEEQAFSAAGKAAAAKIESGNLEGARADLVAMFNTSIVQSSHAKLKLVAWNQVLDANDKINGRITFQKYLEVAANELNPEDYRFQRADVAYKLGDYATLVIESAAALACYPESEYDFKLRYYLAQGYDYTQQLDKAVAAYDQVVSAYRSSTVAKEKELITCCLLRAGIRLAEQGKVTDAAARFNDVITNYAATPLAALCMQQLAKLSGGAQ